MANKDVAALKAAHPLADVIQAAGVALAFDEQSNLWRGVDDPALEVDPAKGRYRRGDESGDVLAWLMVRFGWGFVQAKKYLENRAGLPAIQPAAALPVAAADGPGEWLESAEMPVEARRDALRDRRVLQALRMGLDYPGGGFEHFLGMSFIAMIHEVSWIPGEFTPAVGYLLDGDTCDQCGKDLSGWQALGRAFRALELDSNGSITTDGQVFCAKCVEKFKRWRGGLHLLAAWKAAQPEAEVEAGDSVFFPGPLNTEPELEKLEEFG